MAKLIYLTTIVWLLLPQKASASWYTPEEQKVINQYVQEMGELKLQMAAEKANILHSASVIKETIQKAINERLEWAKKAEAVLAQGKFLSELITLNFNTAEFYALFDQLMLGPIYLSSNFLVTEFQAGNLLRPITTARQNNEKLATVWIPPPFDMGYLQGGTLLAYENDPNPVSFRDVTELNQDPHDYMEKVLNGEL